MKRIFADGHVHIHKGFHWAQFLDAATACFQEGAEGAGIPAPHVAALFLTESAFECVFQDFARLAADGVRIGLWRLTPTGDPEALWCWKPESSFPLLILAGRQILTSENLEVLALATTANFSEMLPLEETISAVIDAGGLPVIPWGFGKWIGQRGVRIRRLILARPPGVFLGDIGGRPRGGKQPKLLQEGKRRGFVILPGTDPLPFSNQVRIAGRFGWWMVGRLDAQRPGTALKRLLKSPSTTLNYYGKLENPLIFLIHQIRMQIRKKLHSGNR